MMRNTLNLNRICIYNKKLIFKGALDLYPDLRNQIILRENLSKIKTFLPKFILFMSLENRDFITSNKINNLLILCIT